MNRANKSRMMAIASLLAVTVLGSQSQAAPWYVARFNGASTSTDSASNAMANANQVGSASLNLVDVVDPQSFFTANFALNTPIPGDTPADDNNYSIVASGVMTVNTTGSYIFRSFADDGHKVAINGRNIISTGTGCCGNVLSAPVALTAGQKMRIQYTYGEGGGGSYGELSVSSDGGATFSLLGQGSLGGFNAHTGLTVDQSFAPPSGGSAGQNPGLKGEYFATVHANANVSTDAFLAGNPTPTGTYVATSLNYSVAGTVNAHLGADSATLTGGGTNGTDNSVFRLSGFLLINAADDFDLTQEGIQVNFRLLSDDNARLKIGGMTIAEYDGGHGFNDGNTDDTGPSSATEHGIGTQTLTFNQAGFYSLEAFYHNGGGGLGINLQSSIGLAGPVFPLQTIPSVRLFQQVIPEPASLALLGLGSLALLRRRRTA